MKDEIKEKIKAYYVANDIDKITDYITKLQKANKNYSKKIIEMGNKITNLQEENERLKKALCKDNIVSKCKYDYLKRQKEGLELDLSCIKDYKSRCEKAIEYIEKSINNPQPFYKYLFGDENGKVENLDRLLNILQGGKND